MGCPASVWTAFFVNLVNIQMLSLTEKIKQKALEIGFHKIGIVRAEKLKEEGEHLKAVA